MFDSHIQYYAYNNTEGDEFGVGYLGNKEFWIRLLNRWAKGVVAKRFTVEQWEDIPRDYFAGCVLAEIEPEDKEYIVTWVDKEKEYVARIKEDNSIVLETGEGSIPRWVNRLKNQLKEQDF